MKPDQGHSPSDQPVDEEEDRSTLGTKCQCTGLHRDYVHEWSASRAFRELFQNCKDAIMQTEKLDDVNFKDPGYDSKEGVLHTELRHPKEKTLLGFIHYEEKTGKLDLVNFGAKLPLSSLNLGFTTKRDHGTLDGGHGEGFKLAALALLRDGYAVHIEASGYHWNFDWGKQEKDLLYCKLAPSKKAAPENDNAKTRNGVLKEKKVDIDKDVKFSVGIHRKKGMKITGLEFQDWIKGTLDLCEVKDTIQCDKGRLLKSQDYLQRIYLRGLLLDRPSEYGEFKFGYDLKEGTVNRDREWSKDDSAVARNLVEIWKKAIEEDEAKAMHLPPSQKTHLAQYIEMHRDETKWLDVALAEKYIKKSFALKIWQFLRKQDPKRELFYHDVHHSDSDVEIIRKSLRKRPEQLPQSLWNPLRRFNLVQTPQEERCRMLETAPDSQHKETPYSACVKRSLNAALALDPSTQGFKLAFKNGVNVDLDLLLVGDTFHINDKWLDFKESHKNAPCWLSRQRIEHVETFSCLHVVTHLHDLVLVELTRLPDTRTGRTNPSLSLRVLESLQQMSLKVEIVSTDAACELKVSWSDSDHDRASVHGLDPKRQVILHRESTCSQKSDTLIQIDEEKPSGAVSQDQGLHPVAKCGCPRRIVSGKDSSVIFDKLDHEEKYFPMVARTDDHAFFGLPPKALKPKSPAAIDCMTATGCATSALPTRPTRSGFPHLGKGATDIGAIDGDCHSLYDDSNSAHEGMKIRSDLAPTSMSSSASKALRAEPRMDTASDHRRSINPTPSTTPGGNPLALPPNAAEISGLKAGPFFSLNLTYSANCFKKKECKKLKEQIERLNEQIEHLKKQVRDAEATIKTKDQLIAQLQSDPETSAGGRGTKRTRTQEERSDTSSSVRASKRTKELSERSSEMASTAEYSVTSEEDHCRPIDMEQMAPLPE